MIAFLIVIHVICCLGLIAIVLLQAGKGAGLASTFGAQAVESALGAGASDFLKKVTSVMAVVFMLTSLSLAFMTARKSASVLKGVTPVQSSEGTSRQVKVTPEGEVVTEEKVIPGLEGKSKKELQQVLKEITQKLPLGQQKKTDASGETPATSVETLPAQGKEVEKLTPSEPLVQESEEIKAQETEAPSESIPAIEKDETQKISETIPSGSNVQETAVDTSHVKPESSVEESAVTSSEETEPNPTKTP